MVFKRKIHMVHCLCLIWVHFLICLLFKKWGTSFTLTLIINLYVIFIGKLEIQKNVKNAHDSQIVLHIGTFCNLFNTCVYFFSIYVNILM